jgi:hypothetical protein
MGADEPIDLTEDQVRRIRAILAEGAEDPPTVADIEAAIKLVLDLDM